MFMSHYQKAGESTVQRELVGSLEIWKNSDTWEQK